MRWELITRSGNDEVVVGTNGPKMATYLCYQHTTSPRNTINTIKGNKTLFACTHAFHLLKTPSFKLLS